MKTRIFRKTMLKPSSNELRAVKVQSKKVEAIKQVDCATKEKFEGDVSLGERRWGIVECFIE